MGMDAFSARRTPGSMVLAFLLVASLEGCAQTSSGVRPETSTPVATRILGPEGRQSPTPTPTT
jgi:type IV pilus biogenesis protein CpaD/CtpE